MLDMHRGGERRSDRRTLVAPAGALAERKDHAPMLSSPAAGAARASARGSKGERFDLGGSQRLRADHDLVNARA